MEDTSMFCVINDKELFNALWDEITSDQFVNPNDLEMYFIDSFDPSIVLQKDIHLFYIDDSEGIGGKVTFSHTSNHSEGLPLISIDTPSTIIKEVDYHLHGESHIHEDVEAFDTLTKRFYEAVKRNALWISRKVFLNHIITMSMTADDHEDLSFWGGFEFSALWETSQGILGIGTCDLKNQTPEVDAFSHNIRAISTLTPI